MMPALYMECRSECINTICDLAQSLNIRVSNIIVLSASGDRFDSIMN